MIVANMVVRNEADNYLEQVLNRLQDQVDVIFVTDDASTDGTVDLLKSYDKVRVQEMEVPVFRTNEGLLRQRSWDFLSTSLEDQENTLVLAIDADEELYETGPTLEELHRGFPEATAFAIGFCHMWNETHYRVDKAWRPTVSMRLFRYRPGGKFLQRNLACGSEPTYVFEDVVNGKFFKPSGLVMKHLSYIKDEDKKIKYERYMALDGGEFHASSHIQSIMDPPEECTLVPWEDVLK